MAYDPASGRWGNLEQRVMRDAFGEAINHTLFEVPQPILPWSGSWASYAPMASPSFTSFDTTPEEYTAGPFMGNTPLDVQPQVKRKSLFGGR